MLVFVYAMGVCVCSRKRETERVRKGYDKGRVMTCVQLRNGWNCTNVCARERERDEDLC